MMPYVAIIKLILRGSTLLLNHGLLNMLGRLDMLTWSAYGHVFNYVSFILNNYEPLHLDKSIYPACVI